MPSSYRLLLAIPVVLFAALASTSAQRGTPAGEWRAYSADERSTRYSPLDQINKDNVKDLQLAWSWKFDNFGTPAEVAASETTPLMINGVLYFTAGQRRSVIAANAATGETLWVWRPSEAERFDRAPRKIHRGVAYWTNGSGDDRILVVTPGFQLVALNAKNGQPIAGFGQGGIVDLFGQLGDNKLDPVGKIGNSSAPVVIGDNVVVGPAFLVGMRANQANVRGDVMAFNVKTGKLAWAFHTVPRKGEFGYETWENGSAEYTGNAGVWGPFSADSDLGLVYLPVEAPTNDIYGGHRPGNNLFANSLVAVDAKTGKRVWHHQLIHHDIWDYDLPAHPILLDVTIAGRAVKGIFIFGKNGLVFGFDRTNGEPLWPIEERPVPQSDVPGEKTSPTQPIQPKLPPFERIGITKDDLIDFTPELREQALKALEGYRYGGLYMPPSVVTETNKGTLIMPGYQGGANWQSGAADPETGFLYIPSITSTTVIGLAKNPAVDSDFSLSGQTPRVAGGLPIIKPPYGRITAYNMNTGEIVWMVPNGDTPANIKSNPALAGVNLPPTGSPSHAMLLATKTLLFGGEGAAGSPVFRAYDKATGRELWQTTLPGQTTSVPMTYSWQGRQYVLFVVRGQQGRGAQLLAYALPPPPTPGGRGRGAGAGAGGAGDAN